MEPATTPTCPRCGYDLGGAVAAWNGSGKEQCEGASCPLEGVCSECGLSFAWADVMRPDRVTPGWSFEHTPVGVGMGASLVRLFRTLIRLMRPRRLWGGMPLAVSVHRGRAAVVGLTGLVPAYVLCVMLVLVMLTSGWLLAWWASKLDVTSYRFTHGPSLVSHLLSVSTYWFVHWYFDWSGNSLECVTLVGWLWPVMVGPCLLLLPQTMRRVRVSRRHIWRVSLYGLWLIPVAGLAAMTKAYVCNSFFAFATYRPRPNPWPERLAESSGMIALAIAFLMLWLWWSAVTTRYLRLPHGRSVAFVMVMVGLLASMVLLFALPLTRPSVTLYLRWLFFEASP